MHLRIRIEGKMKLLKMENIMTIPRAERVKWLGRNVSKWNPS